MIFLKDTNMQAIYYRKEQKVYKYANDFFKEFIAFLDIVKKDISYDILPLYCYNKSEDVLHAAENKTNRYATGSMVTFKKQAVIRIGINCSSDRLTTSLKRNIRHEIIHYGLWLMDRKWNDNQLDFWCYCYVFDGGAYKPLSDGDKEKYDLFMELYDKYISELSYRQKVFCVDDIIKYLDFEKCNHEEYEKYVKERRDYAIGLFGD